MSALHLHCNTPPVSYHPTELLLLLIRLSPPASQGSAIRVQHALLAASVHAWRPLELLAARTALLGLTLGMVKEAASGRCVLHVVS